MAFTTPRKTTPLPVVRRTAGQSIREEWDRVVNDNLPMIIFLPCMTWLVWWVQWSEVARKAQPQPQFWLALSVIATGVSAIRFLRVRLRARYLVRGERGELKVAEALDELRALGCKVIHDIARAGFNVDHVVVAPWGVYAIETKFASGRGVIDFRNGQGLFMNDQPWKGERDPVAQARGNAAEVRKLIKENCGIETYVTPLVVVVGEWKVKETWKTTDVRVVAEAGLLRYFQRQDQPIQTLGERKLIASHLERSAHG